MRLCMHCAGSRAMPESGAPAMEPLVHAPETSAAVQARRCHRLASILQDCYGDRAQTDMARPLSRVMPGAGRK